MCRDLIAYGGAWAYWASTAMIRFGVSISWVVTCTALAVCTVHQKDQRGHTVAFRHRRIVTEGGSPKRSRYAAAKRPMWLKP
jgi:hypothetical protein